MSTPGPAPEPLDLFSRPAPVTLTIGQWLPVIATLAMHQRLGHAGQAKEIYTQICKAISDEFHVKPDGET